MKTIIKSIHSFNQLGNRSNQEDSRFPDIDNPSVDTVKPFFVVCDGVGGNEKGEVASSTVCQSLGQSFRNFDFSKEFTDSDFSKALNTVFKDLAKVANASNKDMATTLTFLAFHAGGAFAAHIGDSRIYQIRPGEGIMYRSEDHSLVQNLVRLGNLTPEEAVDHPRSNIITRCISADTDRKRNKATVVNITDIQPNDWFMLASDGVLHDVTEQQLVELLSSDIDDTKKAEELAEACKDSIDNNTAILLHISEIENSDSEVEHDKSIEEITSEEKDSSCVDTLKLKRFEQGVHEVEIKEEQQGWLASLFKKMFKK